MAKEKKIGRPGVTDKKKVQYVYLRDSETKKILKKHKKLTDAILTTIS